MSNEQRGENTVDDTTALPPTDDVTAETSEEEGTEPPPDAGIMPVVRPAVTLPNPDVEARQVAPQVTEPETTPQEPVATSVLASGDEPETVPPLRDLPNEEEEAAYVQEKTDPDTRKFPALTTWRQAFLGDRQKQKQAEKNAGRTSYAEDYAPQAEALPTQAIRLVDRLHDSPYQLTGERYKAVAEAKDAHNIMLLALKLGETMFRFGAGALEVETSIIVVTQAYGVYDVEVDITNQSISLNFAPAGDPPASYQRVVRSWGSDFAGLADLHELVSGIAAGEVARDDAQAQLAAIRHRKKTFPAWVTFVANGVWATAFVLFIGGSWFSALLSLGASALSMATVYVMGRWRAPDVFATMAGGVMATALAFGLYWLDIFRDPALMIAASLILLVPSLRVVSAVQDGINGFPITSAGRIVSSMLTYVGLVAGIVVGIVVLAMLGAPEIDITQLPNYQYPYWLVAIFVAVAAMGNAIAGQTRLRLILPTAVVSVIGYLVYIGAIEIGFGPSLAPAAAAVVLGFFARIVALSLRAPQLVVAVPASIFLLPGLMIFRAMYQMGYNVDMMSDGVSVLLQATIIILAMTTGLVLGDSLARPLTAGLKANERRRIGRA
ncbi:MAG: threonine/serine exporter family protein [Micrococcaceae bacterium]|nr:threonine/serine exporter family protein [Micrococcaceae bacterium]